MDVERLKPIQEKQAEAQRLNQELDSVRQNITVLGTPAGPAEFNYEGLNGVALSRRVVATSARRRVLRENVDELSNQEAEVIREEGGLHLDIIAEGFVKGHLKETELLKTREVAAEMGIPLPQSVAQIVTENPMVEPAREAQPASPVLEFTDQEREALVQLRQEEPYIDLQIDHAVGTIASRGLENHAFTFQDLSNKYGIRERDVRNKVLNKGLLPKENEGGLRFRAEEVVAIAYFLNRQQSATKQTQEHQMAVANAISKLARQKLSSYRENEEHLAEMVAGQIINLLLDSRF